MEDAKENGDDLLSIIVKEEFIVQEEDVQYEEVDNRAETLLDTSLDCHECGRTYKNVDCLLRHLASRHGGIDTQISNSLPPTNLYSVISIKEEQIDEVEESPDLKVPSVSVKRTESIKTPLPESKKFECDKCGTKLTYRRGFIRHYREVHLMLKTSKCKICGKIFKRNSYLRTHLETHTKKSMKCFKCGRTYKTVLALLRHLASSHSGFVTEISESLSLSISHSVKSTKEFQADQMDEYPDVKIPSASAMYIETRNNKFECIKCGMILKYRRGLIRHYKEIHLGIKNFKCQKCTKIYKRYPDLRNHMLSHLKKSLECYECGRKCKNILSLLSHLGCHHKGFITDILESLYTPTPDSVTSTIKESPGFEITSETAMGIFKILLQGTKKFDSKKCGLKKNAIRHYKEVYSEKKNFECKQCKKVYSRDSDLKRHLKSHSNMSLSITRSTLIHQVQESPNLKKPRKTRMRIIKTPILGNEKFECDQCGVKLTYKRGFTRHYKEVHLGLKNYKCKICKKIYKRNSELKKHQESHSNKLYSCKICGKVYKGPMSLTRHIKTHAAVAFVKKYECEKCGVILKSIRGLTNHYKEVHLGIKNFQCQYCEKIYKRNFQLKKHLESHSRK